jgi:L-malate glycosyltransferase
MPLGLGGIPVTLLAEALVNRGHEVHVVTVSSEVSAPWHSARGALSVTVVPFRARARDRARDLFRREVLGLSDALGEQPHDVVHAHWTYEFALAAQRGREPVVVTAHDAPFTVLRHHHDLYRLIRLSMAVRTRVRTHHLTAVSPYLAARWHRQMVYRHPIAIVPNISPFEPRREHSRPDGVHIVDIADASRLKNVPTLLRAFARIRQEVPDADLTLVGGGLGTDEACATGARAEGLATGVRFLGILSRDRVRAELARATMMVHASLEEGQPVSLLEALAWGLPIVAGRDSGGCAWTLDDGAAGTLVDVADPQAIANAVIAESNQRRSEPEVGWKLLDTRYSADAVARSYERVYDDAIRRHHG